MDSMHWLWALGGATAAWLVVGAMGRRQSRLTTALRQHVQETQDAQKASDKPATKD